MAWTLFTTWPIPAIKASLFPQADCPTFLLQKYIDLIRVSGCHNAAQVESQNTAEIEGLFSFCNINSPQEEDNESSVSLLTEYLTSKYSESSGIPSTSKAYLFVVLCKYMNTEIKINW